VTRVAGASAVVHARTHGGSAVRPADDDRDVVPDAGASATPTSRRSTRDLRRRTAAAYARIGGRHAAPAAETKRTALADADPGAVGDGGSAGASNAAAAACGNLTDAAGGNPATAAGAGGEWPGRGDMITGS